MLALWMMRCDVAGLRREIYISAVASQRQSRQVCDSGKLVRVYFCLGKKKKITLGRSFETDGRLRSRVSVLVIGRAAVDVTGRWLVSSGR